MINIPWGNDFALKVPIKKKVIQTTGEIEIQSFDPDLVETMNVFLQHNEYVSDWHSTQIEWAADPDNDSSIIAYVQSEMAPIGTYNLIFTGIYDGKRFFTQQRRQFKVTGGIFNMNNNNIYPLDSVVFLDTRGRDGLSAYEIAVARGFQGTESEWLESIRGKNGAGVLNTELVGQEGNVDTYRMNFTDGTFFEFTVTNSSSKLTPEQIEEVVAAISDKITAEDVHAIPSSQKGVANGVATLDANGKLPSNQLPTVDTAPTSNSQNLVTSGGVYQALQNVEIDVDSTLSPTSENPIQNKAVKSALDQKANQATTYSKTEVDNKLADGVYIGNTVGTV